MELRDHLAVRGRYARKMIAKRANISVDYLEQVAAGHQQPSQATREAISKATDGAVAPEEVTPST